MFARHAAAPTRSVLRSGLLLVPSAGARLASTSWHDGRRGSGVKRRHRQRPEPQCFAYPERNGQSALGRRIVGIRRYGFALGGDRTLVIEVVQLVRGPGTEHVGVRICRRGPRRTKQHGGCHPCEPDKTRHTPKHLTTYDRSDACAACAFCIQSPGKRASQHKFAATV